MPTRIGVGEKAQPMGLVAGGLAGDPARAPSAAAILPSSVIADFSVTWGRFAVTNVKNARLSARASVSPHAGLDRDAGRPEAGQPAAVHRGFGSPHGGDHPARRRPRPARLRTAACGRGGRTAPASRSSVAPRAVGPAAASATASAWGPPARWWKPSPTTRPSADQDRADGRIRRREAAARRPRARAARRHPRAVVVHTSDPDEGADEGFGVEGRAGRRRVRRCRRA